jgi:NitT/TauT family transport system substrate-binding protein
MKQLTRLLLVAVLVLLSACTTANPASTPTPRQPVTVQLAWVPTIEYSGLYMAQERGAYANAGLDVTIKPLEKQSPIDAVLSGDAQFGVTSADVLLLARAEGKPLVAVATIYQRSPVAFISLSERAIIQPQDLVGKTVVVDLNGTTAIIYRALLASQGIDPADVNTQPRTDYSNDILLSGNADVMDAYLNNQPVQLAQQGHTVNAILASDYGIDLYPNVLFTTEEQIAKQPELVANFVQATINGMQAAIDNVAAATELTVSKSTQLDAIAEAESMRLALPLMNPAGSRPGMMTKENWAAAASILQDQKLLPASIDVQTAYNLSFLQRAYSGAAGNAAP